MGTIFPTLLVSEKKSGKTKKKKKGMRDQVKQAMPLIRSSLLIKILVILFILPTAVLTVMNFQFNFVVDDYFTNAVGKTAIFRLFSRCYGGCQSHSTSFREQDLRPLGVAGGTDVPSGQLHCGLFSFIGQFQLDPRHVCQYDNQGTQQNHFYSSQVGGHGVAAGVPAGYYDACIARRTAQSRWTAGFDPFDGIQQSISCPLSFLVYLAFCGCLAHCARL